MQVLRMLAPCVPLLLLCGCFHAPRFPGPLGPIGREWRPAPLDLPLPSETVRARATPGLPDGNDNADAIVKAAEYFLDHKPVGFNDDCVGFVRAAYARTGLSALHGNAITFWTAAKAAGTLHHHKLPNVGDIAFFDSTYDRNRDGKQNDPLTHVALVLSVDERTGDLLLAHGGYGGERALFHMNLLQPQDRTDSEGDVINDSMRRPKSGDPAGMKYLGSDLWSGFATFREQDEELWVAATATKVTDL